MAGLILTYQFAISNTLDCLSEHNSLIDKVEQSKNLPQELAYYNKALSHLNQQFGITTIDSTAKSSILEVINRFCESNNLVIRSFPASVHEEKQNFSIQTYEIVIEGSYKPVVQLIHIIEQEQRLARVSSVDIKLVKNRRTKRKELLSTLYIQKIEMK